MMSNLSALVDEGLEVAEVRGEATALAGPQLDTIRVQVDVARTLLSGGHAAAREEEISPVVSGQNVGEISGRDTSSRKESKARMRGPLDFEVCAGSAIGSPATLCTV